MDQPIDVPTDMIFSIMRDALLKTSESIAIATEKAMHLTRELQALSALSNSGEYIITEEEELV